MPISTLFSDLKFSASVTVRPKLRRLVAWPRMASAGPKFICDLRMTPYSFGVATKSDGLLLQNRAHPNAHYSMNDA